MEFERRQALNGGVRLTYTAAGSGPLVVLLHGFPQNAGAWRAVAPLLAARFRVAVPDLRGYGESDKPLRVSDYRDELLRGDVLAILAAEGVPAARIVGHDWGGGIAYSLAIRNPEAVEKLAVINCPHPKAFLRALGRDPAQLFRSWYVWFFQLPWLPEAGLRLAAPWLLGRAFRATVRPSAISEEEIVAYVESIRRPGAARAGINYYRAALGLKELLARGAALPPIAAPTLLVWGEQDAYLGRSMLDGVERYFSGPLRVERWADCSHWVPEEQPERVANALNAFLA